MFLRDNMKYAAKTEKNDSVQTELQIIPPLW